MLLLLLVVVGLFEVFLWGDPEEDMAVDSVDAVHPMATQQFNDTIQPCLLFFKKFSKIRLAPLSLCIFCFCFCFLFFFAASFV